MPTALELKREEWQLFKGLPSGHFEPQELTIAKQQERDKLLTRLQELAKHLKNRFGARRVVLFGSFVNITKFTAASDVDLGVEGLKGKAYWQAWKLAEDSIGERSVDFIDMETASDSLKRAIDRYGIDL